MPWCRGGVLLAFCICPAACLLMAPCPAGCCCLRPGPLVLCESLGLRSLPRSVPLSTSSLSVARNQLCNVDHVLRPFSGLQELSLRDNRLARFPRGLPSSLETLQLQENRITYITTGALWQLGNLTRLDLEDNRIRAVQPGALQGLGRLRVLTLKGNKLTSLPLNLPPSLTHLDLSANCISAIDLPSLSALVNLQVLKINSNCLRSVPENAFDSLRHLRSVELANNLWVCECDILYLYRWLLSGRLKMATDLVCTEPVHLAHRLLLNLSVMTICPFVQKAYERIPIQSLSFRHENILDLSKVDAAVSGVQYSEGTSDPAGLIKQTTSIIESLAQVHNSGNDAAMTRIYPEYYTLETLSYAECLSLNASVSVNPTTIKFTTLIPKEESLCLDTATGQLPMSNSSSIEGSGSSASTNKAGALPTPVPRPNPQQNSVVVVALLTLVCVLVALTMLAVLLVLKRVIYHQQRVAPLQQSQR